jgi:sulfatase maturation enzyme AslB (radical SAM superfamily)
MNTIITKTALAIALISITTLTLAQPPHHKKEECNTKGDIMYNLEVLEKKYISQLSPYDRDRALKYIDEIYFLVKSLDEVKYVRFYPEAMSQNKFEAMLNAYHAAHFASERTKILYSAAMRNYFTVIQVNTIIKDFHFDSDRLEVIEILYPKIIDKENMFALYNCLDFSKDKLDKIIQISLMILELPEEKDYK